MKNFLLALAMLLPTCHPAPAAQPTKIQLSIPTCVEKVQTSKQPRSLGPAGTYRMAGELAYFWPQNYALKVRFLDGTTRQQAALWKRFVAIDKLVNLSFTKVTSGKSDIRVRFDKDDGHWSFVGTQCRTIGSAEPTMNIALTAGVFGDTETEWNRVGLHEICHAIGMVHEHSNPRGGIQWNVPKVLQYYEATQGWTQKQVYEQVLFRYSVSRLRATEVDPKSIMMYPIPAELTMNGFSVGWNNSLTPTDIWFLDQIYPNAGHPVIPKPTAYHEEDPDHSAAPVPPARQLPVSDIARRDDPPRRLPGGPGDSSARRPWALLPTRLSCAWKVRQVDRDYLWLSGRRFLLHPGPITTGYVGLI